MNHSKTARVAALITSVCITFTIVALIADYGYPAHGLNLVCACVAKST